MYVCNMWLISNNYLYVVGSTKLAFDVQLKIPFNTFASPAVGKYCFKNYVQVKAFPQELYGR